jgi:hypothetical protein
MIRTMRRRLALISCVSLVTVVLATFAARRANEPEFPFLANRQLVRPAHEVPNPFAGMTGGRRSWIHTEYGFPGDFPEVLKQAEAELLPKGYAESFEHEFGETGVTARFTPPREEDAAISIYRNTSEPPYLPYGDLVSPPIPRRGWVAVLVVRSQPEKPTLLRRFATWLGGAFGGSGRN